MTEEQIRKMRAAITPGPWKVFQNPLTSTEAAIEKGFQVHVAERFFDTRIGTRDDDPQLHDSYPIVTTSHSPYYEPSPRISIKDADAEFIAASPEIVDFLLAEIDRLKEAMPCLVYEP